MVLGFLAAVTLWPYAARAHFGERYGLGISGTSSVMAVSGRCSVNAHAAYYNPALLGCDETTGVELSYVRSIDSFKAINGVNTSTTTYPTNPDSITNTGSVSTDYPDHQALQLGFHIPLFPEVKWLKERHAQLGLSLHWNLDHLMSINTGAAFSPSYILYERRDSRLFVSPAVGFEVWRDILWLGVGAQFFYTGGASAVILYDTRPAGQLAVDVDPQVSAIVGMRARPFSVWPLSLNVVYYQENNPTIKANARSDIVISGSSVPFVFNSITSLYAEPQRVRFGLAWEEKAFSIESSVVYNMWEALPLPRLIVNFQVPGNNSLNEANMLRDTFSFYNAAMIRWREVSFLLGFGYEPSIVKDRSGPENEIDSDKLIGGLGLYYDLPWLNSRIGAGYQLQHLMSKTVTKADASELGYPSYSVGGQVHAFQVGLSAR